MLVQEQDGYARYMDTYRDLHGQTITRIVSFWPDDDDFMEMVIYPRGLIKISRPCYDKAHRCPGWAGGGSKYTGKYQCYNGYVDIHDRKWYELARCNSCDVRVLPKWIRKLSPFQLYYDLQWKFRQRGR